MEKKEIKISLGTFTIGIISIILLTMAVCIGIYIMNINKKQIEEINQDNLSAYENMTNVINDTNIINNSTIIEKTEKDYSNMLVQNKKEPTELIKDTEKDDDSELVKEFSKKIKNIEKSHYDTEQIFSYINNVDYSNLKYENDVKKLNFSNGEWSYSYKDAENNAVDIVYEKAECYRNYICICIETTNDMKNAYIALAFEVDDDTKINAKPCTPYKINGISGKIKKVALPCMGVAYGDLNDKVFIIMEDGTLKYVDCIEGIKTGEFNAYNCDGLNNKIGKVKDIIDVDAQIVSGEERAGWSDWIIENEKGEYFKWNVDPI